MAKATKKSSAKPISDKAETAAADTKVTSQPKVATKTKPKTKSTTAKAKTARKSPAKKPAKAATKKTAAKKTTAKKVATKTAIKPATDAPLAAPEPIAAAPKVAPVVVTSTAPVLTTQALRKEQLLDEVAKRSGAKRKDVKPIVEAALEVMGEAIGEGQELNLKPLGKVKIARTKQVANGRVINLRLRQSDMVIKELAEKKEAAE